MVREAYPGPYMQNRNIYIGNLPVSYLKSDLVELFSQFGPVLSVKILGSNEMPQNRRFAFIEMSSTCAMTAIRTLNGASIGGNMLAVTAAIAQRKMAIVAPM